MTYELAKQLKDAGFPQIFHYDDQGRRADFPSPKLAALPSLSELIEACGDAFINLRKSDKWWAAGRIVEHPGAVELFGDTAEEAAAKLWIVLNRHSRKRPA